MERKFAGADWLKTNPRFKDISPLGAEVADLLGDLESGLYHLSEQVLRKVNWSDKYVIRVKLDRHNNYATWDFFGLTVLVILCHDRMIRCSIEAAGSSLVLMFHKRKGRTGGMAERHPTIEEAIERVRGTFGLPIDATPATASVAPLGLDGVGKQ